MNKSKFIKLNLDEKKSICQKLNPYDKTEWDIFKEVEKLFIIKYGKHEAIDKIFCGLAPIMGPFNSINVYIAKNRKRIDLPAEFHGFPIFKIYESKTKNYKNMIENDEKRNN
ncbi:hypothetical protein DWB61_17685 [Ancylomarina euxinus]|uniref:Uncharacterized protein n=1 Tax=Ancylomarina euxinus TaxID=2283627 RepID=A0A425XWB0_9BACT|nr:hypothetical protein [Ancylomarina euxinus]MCZ4696488.1 hypothetical protein [Ancylomarina euxinus]RRG18931.1 hypothetical protein DWB61_17685 [Ancylomarina euxinus]